jgi:hypothetical protein
VTYYLYICHNVINPTTRQVFDMRKAKLGLLEGDTPA